MMWMSSDGYSYFSQIFVTSGTVSQFCFLLHIFYPGGLYNQNSFLSKVDILFWKLSCAVVSFKNFPHSQLTSVIIDFLSQVVLLLVLMT